MSNPTPTSSIQKFKNAATRLKECLDESLTYAEAVQNLKARHDGLEKKFWGLYDEIKQSAKECAFDGTATEGREQKEAEMNALDAERKEMADLLKRWKQGFRGVQRSLGRWQEMYVQALKALQEEAGDAV